MSVENNSKTPETLHDNYRWDSYSDQPYSIKDKKYKRSLRLKALPANLKMLAVSIFVFPIIFYRSMLLKRVNERQKLFEKIGVCVNLDKEPNKTHDWLVELGVKRISIRIPLSDIDSLDDYYHFAKQLDGFDILFVILQDRKHIENPELLKSSFTKVFGKLSPLSDTFQIGNAINRTKWGFVSIDEYLKFFSVAKAVRDKQFPSLKLIGSGVIDFEIYALIRTLWNAFPLSYNGVAALLYVDRRGAPENKQFVFDLIGKINFFYASVLSSSKTDNRLFITETNWPIEHTKPYAPAADDVWVNEDDYGNFMLRYFLLALANGNVECIYWHQLVAPGYGLIDNRDGEIRKRKAFFMLKKLVETCKTARIVDVDKDDGVYTLYFKNTLNQGFRLTWNFASEKVIRVEDNFEAFDAVGNHLSVENNSILIGEEPVYLVEKLVFGL